MKPNEKYRVKYDEGGKMKYFEILVMKMKIKLLYEEEVLESLARKDKSH